MEEWKECKLGEICTKITDGSHFSPQACQTGYPMFSVKDMLEYGFDYSNCKHISAKDFESMKNGDCVPQKGDILVAKDGSFLKQIFECKETKEEAILSSIAMFRPNQDFITPTFLCYLLKSPKVYNYIASNCVSGSALPRIVLKDFKKVSMQVPPLPTQQKIAAILSSLDDKIELNNKINTNLEQQAQALFKNFSEKSSKSVKFTDLIYILGGGTPKTNNEDYWNGKIPFFTPKDVGNPYCLLTEKKITESGLDNCNSRLYPVNTIFVTARGTVGKVCLAGLPMAMNQSCYALKSKEDNQLLAYFYTLEAINSLKHKANGATFDAIVTSDFETETINILSEQDTKEFTQIVKPIFEKILTNQKENINLSNLRDTLLPRLMNGEIETNHMGD